MTNIDHPLILLFEGLCAVGMFRYFFLTHRAKQPAPRVAALFAFLCLLNLVARTMGAGWFFIVDALMWFSLASLVWTICHQKAEANKTNPQPPAPDLLDGLAGRVVGMAILIAGGCLVFQGIRSYQTNQKAEQRQAIAVDQARIDEKKNAEAKFDSLQQDLDSLRTITQAVVTGVQSISVSQQKAAAHSSRQRAAIQSGVAATQRGIDTMQKNLTPHRQPTEASG